ncbi:hypothetical protein [Arhodomonas sp. KWT]|uniref:hypothetical protein n=1 Tax=Arhodomonas sp. KWT TaxID=2679915 RepID=UPI0013D02C61|nr:hypothetical protein [Arhodomonas sp. KWT]
MKFRKTCRIGTPPATETVPAREVRHVNDELAAELLERGIAEPVRRTLRVGLGDGLASNVKREDETNG